MFSLATALTRLRRDAARGVASVVFSAGSYSVQINITSRHGTVRSEDHAYFEEKAGKLVTYFERVTQIDVTVDFGHDAAKVELKVDCEHKHDFVASSEDADAVVAFNAALHKMEQQIRKYKERVQNHHGETSMSGQ